MAGMGAWLETMIVRHAKKLEYLAVKNIVIDCKI